MSEKVLSIVIPCFNKFNFTNSCLADLSKLPDTHQLVVIDNGSTDETQTKLQGSTEITYYRNDENLGFSKACNIGHNLSTAPNVMFLNNDIRVKENHSTWTQPIIDKCNDGLVGPTMGLLDDNLNFVKEANAYLNGNSYMSGWCLSSSKEIWNKLIINNYIGPFDERYGKAYFEDTDVSFFARKLGISMHVVDIPVVHFGKQTSKQLNTYELYTKARDIFVQKWGKK